MIRPSWRAYLGTWRDCDGHEARTRSLEAVLSVQSLPADRAPIPGCGRLSALRGPIDWLSVRPSQQTAEGRIVARLTRLSWGREGTWLRFPICRVGWGHWAAEEWLPSRGWVRLPEDTSLWPRKREAVLPGMAPMWRRCGTEELVAPFIAVRHVRAALVHWRASRAEIRSANISAADLMPLLGSPEVGVRDGALQAVAWVAPSLPDEAHERARSH